MPLGGQSVVVSIVVGRDVGVESVVGGDGEGAGRAGGGEDVVSAYERGGVSEGGGAGRVDADFERSGEQERVLLRPQACVDVEALLCLPSAERLDLGAGGAGGEEGGGEPDAT